MRQQLSRSERKRAIKHRWSNWGPIRMTGESRKAIKADQRALARRIGMTIAQFNAARRGRDKAALKRISDGVIDMLERGYWA